MTTDPKDLIVGVSGIRGVVGRSLTAEVATAFAQALGTYLQGQPVVVSRDSRPSGEMLRDAVAAGLMSAGCDVFHLSIASTPTCGIAVRAYDAAGGVQITASHNAAPYNGLKLFGREGTILTAAEGEEVLRLYRHGPLRSAAWHDVGTCRMSTTNPMRTHLSKVLHQIDGPAIQKRRFHVLLDANHGAGGPLALLLLGVLDCRVTKAGCEPDGHFAHEPEPTEEHLRGIAPLVRENQCDLGFALDPDADRLALIDETGRYIGEELTLALAAEFRLRQTHGPVVANMSTSRLLEDIAHKHHCAFFRVPVGEANVAQKMREVEAILGGEGNGGVMDPRVGLVRDPFIGMALILNLLAETGMKLSALVALLPTYHIVKTKQTVDREAMPALYARLQARWPDAKANTDDGLRLDWPDRWVHVRPSNTEPIIRVIAEAPQREEAEELCRTVRQEGGSP